LHLLEEKNMRGLLASVLFSVLLLLGLPKRAEALYLDPGTGSIVLQVMIGSFLAAMAMVRVYWSRLRSLFRRKNGDARETSQDTLPTT
jgi:heme/copper-type cytochrome/quinol oxidase subunit 1